MNCVFWIHTLLFISPTRRQNSCQNQQHTIGTVLASASHIRGDENSAHDFRVSSLFNYYMGKLKIAIVRPFCAHLKSVSIRDPVLKLLCADWHSSEILYTEHGTEKMNRNVFFFFCSLSYLVHVFFISIWYELLNVRNVLYTVVFSKCVFMKCIFYIYIFYMCRIFTYIDSSLFFFFFFFCCVFY